MRKDENWLREHLERTGGSYVEGGKRVTAEKLPGVKTGKAEPRRGQVITRLSEPAPAKLEFAPEIGTRKKNKTEKRFEDTFLVPAKLDGRILKYKFEQLTLLLGDGTRYTPDFLTRWENGVLQIFEIKGGYIHEDARVKFHCACTQFPEFAFQLCQWKQGEWRTLAAVRCKPITGGSHD